MGFAVMAGDSQMALPGFEQNTPINWTPAQAYGRALARNRAMRRIASLLGLQYKPIDTTIKR